MNDLFDFAESLEERKGIMADSNIHDDELAYTYTESWRHECEVRDIVSRYFPKGDPKPEFLAIEKVRGKVAADRLRNDCRTLWRSEAERAAMSEIRRKVDSDKGGNK